MNFPKKFLSLLFRNKFLSGFYGNFEKWEIRIMMEKKKNCADERAVFHFFHSDVSKFWALKDNMFFALKCLIFHLSFLFWDKSENLRISASQQWTLKLSSFLLFFLAWRKSQVFFEALFFGGSFELMSF
jgi:hypothetical protein